eukprot:16430496-Heterocapsa_arctica.AAC.1
MASSGSEVHDENSVKNAVKTTGIVFATDNVCTLRASRTRAKGTELSGRTQPLEMAFDKANLDIVGVQGGR